MTGGFFVFLLTGALTIGSLILLIKAPGRDAAKAWGETHTSPGVRKREVKFIFIIMLIIFAIITAMNTVYSVPVKNVGIPISFGKPGTPEPNGIMVVEPWVVVEKWDTTSKTKINEGDWDHGCTKVRIKTQALACVYNRLRYHILDESAGRLYQSYKKQDQLDSQVIDTALGTALTEYFGTYDPTETEVVKETVNGEIVEVAKLKGYKPDVAAEAITKILFVKIGKEIVIDAFTAPLVLHDKATEDKIAQYQSAIANQRVALVENATADTRASTAQKLASKLTMTTVLDECLDVVRDAINKNYPLPANFCNFAGSQIILPTGLQK